MLPLVMQKIELKEKSLGFHGMVPVMVLMEQSGGASFSSMTAIIFPIMHNLNSSVSPVEKLLLKNPADLPPEFCIKYLGMNCFQIINFFLVISMKRNWLFLNKC